MGKIASGKQVSHSLLYAAAGFTLGILAPIGWVLLRLVLFWDADATFWSQVLADIQRSRESLALYAYMGGGTAVVLGTFGFFIGRSSEQMHERAANLDALNRAIAEQKEEFEHKFRDLDSSIKNFHAINHHIQKSVDIQEIMRLSADGLHDILGYDRVNLLLVTPDRTRLQFIASRGSEKLPDSGLTLPLDDRAGALFKAYREKRVLLVEDVRRMNDEYHIKPPCAAIPQLRSRSFIICPIVVQDEVVGLFGVDRKSHRKMLVDTDVDTVKLFADQISAAMTKINLLEAVGTLTGELEHTFEELLKYQHEHARHDLALKKATASTTEATAEIAGAAEVVREAVDSTRSSSGEISVSIDEVSRNLCRLTEFMEKSIAAMTQISFTIKAVQENGVRSNHMSETVRQQAEKGVAAVKETLTALQGIAVAVDKAVAAIQRLSERGERINNITTVISEITQKTNLLALNAAIIAAQAGEHGRSFAVVADEVRSLSQEAAHSTGAITQIIDEIQQYTQETVDHIGMTRRLVKEGVSLGEGMDRSLQQILDSSRQAMDMSHEIRKATHEVAQSVDSVSVSIEDLGEMSSQITQASGEQAQGTRSIVRSIEEIKTMSDDMALATEKQRQNTRDIEGAVAAVSEMARRIFAEMEERKQGSREVIEKLESLKGGKA